MNRESFDSLITQAIDEAMEIIGEGRPSPTRTLTALQRMAQRVAGYSRDYTLLNLRTVEDVAEEFGVSRQAIRRIAADRHERFGTGMKLGNTWVWSVEEIEMLRPHYRQK